MIWPPPHRDSEQEVAAYVAGELSTKDLRRFEAHLLDCERCWSDVQLNRKGRRLAEWGWEPAPARLRQDVRSAVGLSGSAQKRRLARWGLVALAAGVVASMAVTAIVLRLSAAQPPEIVAALTLYRTEAFPATPPERGAPNLRPAGLELVRAGATRLGPTPVDAFVYHRPSGARIVLFLASTVFPEALGAAERGDMARGWTASADGLYMLCGSRPTSFLLVGTDRELLQRVESALAGAPIAGAG